MNQLHLCCSRRLAIAILTIGLFLVSGMSSSLFAQGLQQYNRKAPPSEEDVFFGRVWVKFKPDVSVAVSGTKTGLAYFDQAAQAYGVNAINRAFPILEHYASKRQLSDSWEELRNVYEVHYDGPYNPLHVAEALAGEPDVELAEPIPIMKLVGDVSSHMLVPNDSLFDEQEDYLDRIHVPEAWDHFKGTDTDAVIAILDGGTNWKHEDLGGNLWANSGEIANNGVDDDDNGFIDDVRGWNFAIGTNDPTGLSATPNSANHGTLTASMASANTNNTRGIAGTSYNATYMPVNVACSFFDLALCYATSGVMYASLMGATVINASYGSSFYSSITESVYKAAHEEGTLTVAAAGNFSGNVDNFPFYPASYGFTLSVGGLRPGTSQVIYNYGTTVDVYGQAQEVWGAMHAGNYAQGSGTSFSSPQVVGIAALVMAAFPESNPDQLRERIRLTADNIDDDNLPQFRGLLGQGRVNAYRAVTEDGYPAVRLIEGGLEDSDKDGKWPTGETGTLKAKLVNYLAPATGVTLRAESESGWVIFDTPVSDVSTIGTLDTVDVEFSLRIHEAAPYRTDETVSIVMDLGDTSQTLWSTRIEVNPAQFKTHNSGAMQASITTEGNFGFIDYAYNSAGDGIRFLNSNNLSIQALWGGGMMFARSPRRVSDAAGIYGAQDLDIVPASGSVLAITRPGATATEDGLIVFDDSRAKKPMDVEIKQETFVHSGADYEDFMIARYTIMNKSARMINDFHVAWHADWDAGFLWFQNQAVHDEYRRMGFISDGTTAESQTHGVGTKVLTHGIPMHAFSGGPFTFSPFDDTKKWEVMTGGIAEAPTSTGDFIQLVGAGPMTIEPGGETEVAFAIVGGGTRGDLLQNADNAQRLWDTKFDPTTYIQFIQNNADLWLDVYINGEKVIDDLRSHWALPYKHFEPGSSKITLTPFWAPSDQVPYAVASVEVDLAAAERHQVFVFGNDQEVTMQAVSDPPLDASSGDRVEFYPVHAANDIGTIDLRLVDPWNENEVIGYLENNLAPKEFGETHSLIPARYTLEISTAEDNERLEIFRFDTSDWAGQLFVLNIAGNGMSFNEGLRMMLTNAAGEMIFPNVFTSTEVDEELPGVFALEGNYPNPFNPTTTIQFDLPSNAEVTVHIVDMLGRQVMTVPARKMTAGTNRQIRIDAPDLASGTYFYRVVAEMETETAMQTGTMLLIK